MKKLIALSMVGTLLFTVSCGSTTTARNMTLDNAKTSAYNVTDNTNTSYVPGTYSANRVKYYDGLYNSSRPYLNNVSTNANSVSNTNVDGYKDVRNSSDANYLKNSYVNTNTMYQNDMYTDLSVTDFNNGLITNDHNVDTKNATNTMDTAKIATNALNYSGGASKTMMTRVDDRTINTDMSDTMNAVNYEVDNTYKEVKTATKNMVDDVATDAKVAVNKAKINTQKMMNEYDY